MCKTIKYIHELLGSDGDLASLLVITEVYIHPLFESSSFAYDLAIVETYEVIPFSSKVGPACLPFKHVYKDFVGDTIKVFGKLGSIIRFCIYTSFMFVYCRVVFILFTCFLNKYYVCTRCRLGDCKV